MTLDEIHALPVAADTAAWAVPFGRELRLFLNRPPSTLHLRLAAGAIESLPDVPMVLAGAAACDDGIVVTGADAAGHPIVAMTGGDGAIQWQHALAGPAPLRWPVPACLGAPAVVWQTAHRRLEVAAAGPGIAGQRSVDVGEPPVDLSAGNGVVRAAWPTSTGVEGVEIDQRGTRAIGLQTPGRPDTVAIGGTPAGTYLVWRLGTAVYVTPLGGTTMRVEIGEAANGTIAAVSGTKPLVWAQLLASTEPEEPRWTSSLAIPGADGLELHQFVHAVTWWGDRVAVVGVGDVRIFRVAEP